MSARRTAWPYAVLAGEAMVFFRQALFSHHYTLPWDFSYYHYPLLAIMSRAFAAGEFPLWDVSTYCGRPFHAVIQAQAYYPPAILTALGGAAAGERWLRPLLEIHAVAHVALAGAFAYMLLRALRLGVAPALIGATVFQLGAFFASQAQHLGAVDGAAWMPLAWYAVVRLAEGFTWRRLAVLAAALALSFLAGFTPVTLVVWISTGMVAAALAAARLAPLRVAVFAALGMAWAALLGAAQLLSTAELVRHSVASGRWQSGGGGLTLGALATLVWPNWWGVLDFAPATWKLPLNPTFLYLYCGIPALVFAAAALARRIERRTAVFALLTAVFALWMLGNSTPVGRAVYPLWPAAARNAMYVEFAMAPFVLALAVLAAIGAGALLEGRRRAVQVAAVLLVAADLTLAGAGRPMNTADVRGDPGVTWRQIDGIEEAPPLLRELTGRGNPPSRIDNLGGSPTWTSCSPAYGVAGAGGDDPLALTRLLKVRTIFGSGAPWGRYFEVADATSPILDLLNVEYLVSRLEEPVPGVELEARIPWMTIWRNPGVLPRFFLVGRAHRAADLEAALARMRAPDFDPRVEAVVEGPFEGVVGGAGTVRVVEYRAREVALEVEASAPALLVSSEAWYPGWRAWIGGEERRLVIANAAFRGLAVPAGRHVVKMRFDPPLLWPSVLLSLAALAGLAAALAIGDNELAAAQRRGAGQRS